MRNAIVEVNNRYVEYFPHAACLHATGAALVEHATIFTMEAAVHIAQQIPGARVIVTVRAARFDLATVMMMTIAGVN